MALRLGQQILNRFSDTCIPRDSNTSKLTIRNHFHRLELASMSSFPTIVLGCMRMRFRRLLIPVIASLTFPEMAVSQGRIEHITSPSGFVVNYTKCARKASICMNRTAQYCNGPYQVIDSESHAGGAFADTIPGPVTWYSMVFLCGKSDGRFPKFEFRGPQFQMPSIIVPNTIRTTCTKTGNIVRCMSY